MQSYVDRWDLREKVLFCTSKVSPHILCLVCKVCLFFLGGGRAALMEYHYTLKLAPDNLCPTRLTGSCSRLLLRRPCYRILHGLEVTIKWESLTVGTSFVAWVTEKTAFTRVSCNHDCQKITIWNFFSWPRELNRKQMDLLLYAWLGTSTPRVLSQVTPVIFCHMFPWVGIYWKKVDFPPVSVRS